MRTIRQTIELPEQLNANDFDAARLAEVKQERCGICYDLWPSSMMLVNDGLRRCPDCYDTQDLAAQSEIRRYDAYRVQTRQTRPQISQAKLDSGNPPFIRTMETAGGARVLPSSPLNLSRGGAAVTLIIKGGDFLSSDTFSYSSGLSNNSAPSLAGSTQWTLSLVAAGGMTAGQWHLTYNNHTYRNIFSVR